MTSTENHDNVQIKYKKYSFWTVLKIVLGCMGITWLFNLFAYGTVGINHIMSKALHLASDFVALCQSCLNALS